MRTSKLLKGTVVTLLVGTGLPLQTFTKSPRDVALQSPGEKSKEKRVLVTGSLIPQNVKVKAISTATTSSVRVYKRDEIDRYGRFTTQGILALDPRFESGLGIPGNN